jgi:hypothetical protein
MKQLPHNELIYIKTQEAAEGRTAHNNVWNGINMGTMYLIPFHCFWFSHYYEPILPY